MGRVQLSPDEERILRSFYRRHALPYVAGTAAVAVVALGASLFAGDPEAAAEAARTEVAALAGLRGEVQQLLGVLEEVRRQTQAELVAAEERLSGLSERSASAPREATPMKSTPSPELVTLKKRIDAAVSRLEKAETRLDELASDAPVRRAAATAPPPEAAAWDVSSILDRLYNAELRLDAWDAKRGNLSQEVLTRLEQVEASGKRRISEGVEVEKSLLNRLYNLEARFEKLESVVAARPGSTAPASPAR